jgi:dTDP-4-dehydrorhamnose 3,5-epimerase
MKIFTTALNGVLLLEGMLRRDERGYFTELFNRREFHAASGLNVDFVQDNLSHSHRNVLRGLHYQVHEPQGKLIRVLHGEVFDVIVDLRRSSPSYGQSAGFKLNAGQPQALWVPPGLAHGFLALSETVDCLYKTTTHYAPQHERCLRWDDPRLGITWPLQAPPLLSARDRLAKGWNEVDKFD